MSSSEIVLSSPSPVREKMRIKLLSACATGTKKRRSGKTPPRPLSQKRVAEGLLGRVRRAGLYVLWLWQASDAAALYTVTFLFGGYGNQELKNGLNLIIP